MDFASHALRQAVAGLDGQRVAVEIGAHGVLVAALTGTLRLEDGGDGRSRLLLIDSSGEVCAQLAPPVSSFDREGGGVLVHEAAAPVHERRWMRIAPTAGAADASRRALRPA